MAPPCDSHILEEAVMWMEKMRALLVTLKELSWTAAVQAKVNLLVGRKVG